MRFAVVMRKQNIDNPWISYKWVPQEVLPDFGQFQSPAIPQYQICGQFQGCDAGGESWLFTGYELSLFPDEAEGYYLNLSATQPCWFVMWRLEEEVERYIHEHSIAHAKSETTIAIPHRLSLSYNEAGRLLDGGESVDSIPMTAEHASWLQEYVNEHYHPEPKKRHRPESFKGADRSAEK